MAIPKPPTVRRALDIPPDRLAPIFARLEQPAILESGPGFGQAGRWSIYAAQPRLLFEATGDSFTVRHGGDLLVSRQGDALDYLAYLLDRFGGLARPEESPDPALPPFQGGMIGFFGYDLAPRLERLPRKAPRDSRMPDIRMAFYDTAVTFDRQTGAVELWAHPWEDGTAEVEHRARAWARMLTMLRPRLGPKCRLGPLATGFTREGYHAAVERALDYIAAGDIFQVNLSQRFEARGKPDALDLYLRLKAQSPAPFSAFLRWDDLAVVSASPEWFYQTRGDRIVTRPIKGTRPRGRDPAEDEALAGELRRSVKDRAELTMIVDLERNDLGRVSEFGTVRVLDPLTVESFAQVHHLVATVEGRIRAGLGPIDVLRAMFPGGSITGAPKIRAMQIIDELEPTRRGLYTGAIGYFSRGGASAFNIAIRTMIVEGDRVHYQVGGGIVADSDPEAEYLETLHKGRGLRAVIGGEDR